MKNCVIVTGGGTAGHIMPIIALLPELKKHFKEIVYIGSHNGMEKEIVKNYPFVRYCAVDTVKFDRVHLLKNLAIPFRLLKSVGQCKKIIKSHSVDCIFSKGGYVSLPCVLASGSIPVIAHESDISLGLANKIAYFKCKVMCTSYKGKPNAKKCVYTGLPIREFKTENSFLKLNLDKNKKTLLVIGGSLGATSLNETVITILDKICDMLNVIHIVGKGNLTKNNSPKNYNQIEFTLDMGYIFSHSDFALSRAGATTICELIDFNIPMLLVPLSKKASRGDQEQNAEYFTEHGYALTLLSKDLTPNNLYDKLVLLTKSEEKIKKAQKNFIANGTHNVMEQILKYSK